MIFSSKKKTTLIASLIGISATFSVNTLAQSLESVVAQTLDTHPEIRQAFARFKVKEEAVNQASSGYLPTIDLTAGYGYEFTDTPSNRRNSLGQDDGTTEMARGEFGVSLKQILFDGLFTQNNVKRTMSEASAEQWVLVSTAEDLALSVAKAYLQYLKTEQLVELAEKNIVAHEEIYAQIKERTDSGLGSIADFSQVTGRLARSQSNLIAARNNHLDARSQYIRLTNQSPKDLVIPVPDADLLPNNRQVGIEQAIDNHPVIKSAQQDVLAARANKKTVTSTNYPSLSLELDANADNDIGGEDGYNRTGSDVGGHRENVTVMLRMRYNLYAGGEDRSKERSAAYELTQAQELNANAHRQVKEGFSLSWNAYEMLALQKKYIKQHIETSKETQMAYKEQFNIGQRNLLDLLDTENELFQARQDYLEAQFSEIEARYRLLNATGQLLDSLRVTRAKAWQGEHDYTEIADEL